MIAKARPATRIEKPAPIVDSQAVATLPQEKPNPEPAAQDITKKNTDTLSTSLAGEPVEKKKSLGQVLKGLFKKKKKPEEKTLPPDTSAKSDGR